MKREECGDARVGFLVTVSIGLAATSFAATALAATALAEVWILEGDRETVSGEPGAYRLRFDDEVNDLGTVMARTVLEVGELEGTLIFFTTFDDLGGGGPAYFVPIYNEVEGTGLERIDRRTAFGTTKFEGLVNMKTLDSHAPHRIQRVLAQEIAHRHLAYMSADRGGENAVVPPLVGRQNAHWNAALDSDASVLEGYDWSEIEPGRFVVSDKCVRFSRLDLYGLGLVPAGEVDPFFIIQDARTELGFLIPTEAQLPIGAVALGSRLDLTIDDVVRALGPRRPEARAAATTMRVVFALLTEPGESATSTRAEQEARAIDRLRIEMESTWDHLTGGRGALCTRIDGCAEGPSDAGEEREDASQADAIPIEDAERAGENRGCSCAIAR